MADLTNLMETNELSAMQGSKTFFRDPAVKGRVIITRFCGYCRSYGHSISTCNKKKLYDEIQKIRSELLK